MGTNYICSNDVLVCGNKVTIKGKKLPPCPAKGNNVSTINGKVYIDGYEFVRGKWRKTLKALWHKWF